MFHPNIDEQGRVCLNSLTLPPKGMWSPLLTIEAMLLSIQQLMTHPNGTDGLSKEATDVYNSNRAEWERRARDMTAQHAVVGKKCEAEESKIERKPVGEADQETHQGVSGVSEGKRKREDGLTTIAEISAVEESGDKRTKVA